MRFAITTLAVLFAVFSTACVPVASCHDGIRNGSESDVDCGGSCAAGCADGDHCFADSDCDSHLCGNDQRCATAVNPCADGVRDGNESDIDCGGSCGANCAVGDLCVNDGDCSSTFCASNGRCAAVVNLCTDGVRDGNETDTDCGGSCGANCPLGYGCAVDNDCVSHFCAGDSRCTPDITVLPNESNAAGPYVIDPGVGLVVSPGQQAGYGITANTGASYRIVWTGDASATNQYHEFTGTVWTNGHFSNFVPGCNGQICPLEANDFVSSIVPATGGGEIITFDTFATDGLDGFDFVSSTEPVYFDLRIDGNYVETLVFFSSGGQASNPAGIPFALQSN